MFRAVLIFFLLIIGLSPVNADNTDDLTAIKQTATDYMEAWYQGDSKKMKQCLHKKLAKRSLLYGHHGGATLRNTKASHMVSYTSSGIGQKLEADVSKIEVVVLDSYKNIASVKVITPHYYEYLHLVKIDDEWSIVNALYE